VQMKESMSLPIVATGALMPDAHLGYGLPIGGVLATRNAIIPNAVGVDIACRMKMTATNISVDDFLNDKELRERIKTAIMEETAFGTGACFSHEDQRDDDVMSDSLWHHNDILREGKSKAREQLGSSGGGNHFVEFGVLKSANSDTEYVAILSHSGSRGIGHSVASHYHKVAVSLLPDSIQDNPVYKNLAWLYLDSDEGQEYWDAMNLMGRYASANHTAIHNKIAENLGLDIWTIAENHHNFAWKENHNGEDLIVHRKGATPAYTHNKGIIPGTMADSCFVVIGKGNPESLRSASHGAGRTMSRTEAKNKFNWEEWKKILKEKKIDLLGAGLDEMPGAYKNIHDVMDAQKDLVEILGEFMPSIVRMAGASKRPGKKNVGIEETLCTTE